jgi:hypothetical protein
MLQGFVLFIHGLFNNITGILEHRASDNSIITELCTGKGMEGRPVTYFVMPPGTFIEGPKKPHETTIRTDGVPAEIRNVYLRNVNKICFCRAKLFNKFHVKFIYIITKISNAELYTETSYL